MLFLWSIVAGAVGYLKKQRMAQWMKSVITDTRINGKQLILRRLSTSAPAVRPWHRSHSRHCKPSDAESSDRSASSLLWSTDGSEVLLDDGPVSRMTLFFYVTVCKACG